MNKYNKLSNFTCFEVYCFMTNFDRMAKIRLAKWQMNGQLAK